MQCVSIANDPADGVGQDTLVLSNGIRSVLAFQPFDLSVLADA